ncbi:MAG: hypothetical protein AAFY46_14550, partial [Planctomycetota bacterium]
TKTTSKTIATVSMMVLAGSTGAQLPQFMWDGGMKHVLIAFDGTNVGVEVDPNTPSLELPLEMQTFGESYQGNASVLDGTYYSSQYGFLADGFISLPQGASISIEMLSATPGLNVYEGGLRMMRENHTYTPIFGTDGSDITWEWGGTMHHPWFAVDELGFYEAEFEVYISDAVTGDRLSGFVSDTVTLQWQAVPAPGAAALLGLGGLAASRRRR